MAVISTLHQKKTLQRSWSFILDDAGSLRVQTRQRGTEKDFIVELRNLSPKAMRTRNTAWVMWIFGWAFAAGWVATLLSILIGLRGDPWAGRLVLMAFVSIIFVPIALKALQQAAAGTYNATLFHNRWNGQAAISVDNNSPDPEAAQKFIELLTRQVELAAPSEARGEGLADQVEKLNELRQRGVLTDTEFAAAKERLLAGTAPEKKIGFH